MLYASTARTIRTGHRLSGKRRYSHSAKQQRNSKTKGAYRMNDEKSAIPAETQECMLAVGMKQLEYFVEQTQHYAYWKRLKSMRPMSELT